MNKFVVASILLAPLRGCVKLPDLIDNDAWQMGFYWNPSPDEFFNMMLPILVPITVAVLILAIVTVKRGEVSAVWWVLVLVGISLVRFIPFLLMKLGLAWLMPETLNPGAIFAQNGWSFPPNGNLWTLTAAMELTFWLPKWSRSNEVLVLTLLLIDLVTAVTFWDLRPISNGIVTLLGWLFQPVFLNMAMTSLDPSGDDLSVGSMVLYYGTVWGILLITFYLPLITTAVFGVGVPTISYISRRRQEARKQREREDALREPAVRKPPEEDKPEKRKPRRKLDRDTLAGLAGLSGPLPEPYESQMRGKKGRGKAGDTSSGKKGSDTGQEPTGTGGKPTEPGGGPPEAGGAGVQPPEDVESDEDRLNPVGKPGKEPEVDQDKIQPGEKEATEPGEDEQDRLTTAGQPKEDQAPVRPSDVASKGEEEGEDDRDRLAPQGREASAAETDLARSGKRTHDYRVLPTPARTEEVDEEEADRLKTPRDKPTKPDSNQLNDRPVRLARRRTPRKTEPDDAEQDRLRPGSGQLREETPVQPSKSKEIPNDDDRLSDTREPEKEPNT